MRGRKTSLVMVLADSERIELERWVRCSSMAAGLVRKEKSFAEPLQTAA